MSKIPFSLTSYATGRISFIILPMGKVFCISLFVGHLLLGVHLAHGRPGATVFFGQSPDFWKYAQDASKESLSTENTRELIRGLSNNMELGFGRLNLHSDVNLAQGVAGEEWPTQFEFTIEGQGAGVVASRGFLSNEVRFARLYGALLKGSFQGNLAEDLYGEFTLALGGGSQSQVVLQDLSTEIRRAENRGVTLLGGLDLKLQKIWRLGDSRLINTLQTEETYFKTINESFQGIVNWPLRNLSHNWQFRTDYLFSQLNLHFLLAVHPYPTLLLPRFWERLSEASSASRSLRSLMGGGGGFTFRLGSETQVAGLVGYYAGAPGGELRFRFFKAVGLRLSTYSVENSSDYQVFSQRVFAGGMEVSF